MVAECKYLDRGSIATSHTSMFSHAVPAPGRRTKWEKEIPTREKERNQTHIQGNAAFLCCFKGERMNDMDFHTNLLLYGGDIVVDLPQRLLDLAVLTLELNSHLTDLRLHLITKHFHWQCLGQFYTAMLDLAHSFISPYWLQIQGVFFNCLKVSRT